MSNKTDILKSFTILCVEDEIEVRNELAKFLKRRVKELYVAGNGAEGLAMFKEHSPDIVITDVLMPVMNGLDMTKAIKEINPDIPVIVTTAFNDHEYFLRAIEMGVSKYVLKPIDILQFLESINEVAWLLRAQRELHISATVFNASAEAIVVTDESNTIISVNPAFSLITGYDHDDIVGKNPKFLNSGRQSKEFYQAMWKQLKETKRWEGEIWNRRKNGEIYPEWLNISLVVDEKNNSLYHVAIFSDMTARKTAEQKLYHMAHYDPLTNLPNRTLLQDRLHQGIGQASRNDVLLALMFIDLDRFKYVNDTFGHLVGDLLLQEVSSRLKACVRVTDTIARMGGDEFVVLLPQVADFDSVAKIAQNILTKLTSVFELDGHEIYIGGSIGIAMYPDNGTTTEGLMKAADSAMYAVKEAGRNNFRFFHSEINDKLQERLEMESSFVAALNQKQFEVLYQPIFDGNRCIAGVEALVRWNKADGTVLQPVEFLPLAEQTGFMLQLGKWVFRTALTDVKKQQEKNPELKVTINVSSKQLQAPDFADYVSNLLRELKFDPTCLELEISEEVLIHESETCFFAINHLHKLGVTIAVDDFGMSYSTLLHLRSLPVGRLKINRELMANADAAGKDTFSIVSAVIAMANSLSLKVTMSGVENPSHANLISQTNGLERQGFHLSRPLHLSELESQLTRI